MAATADQRTPQLHQHASILVGSLWMIGLSLLLFFVPAVNGLIAGVVGGYLVGSIGRALGAAVLPALIVAAGLWILLGLLGLPVIGFFAGAAVGFWVLLSEVGLLIGATVGGAAHQLLQHS